MDRRDFLKLCLTATAMMGLPASMHATVMAAAQAPNRPPVIWLHFQECTGCSESLLRSSHPDVASLTAGDDLSGVSRNTDGRFGRTGGRVAASEP